jgi:FKBP-type peptidyl-prolyl cis-trans isomerase FklB
MNKYIARIVFLVVLAGGATNIVAAEKSELKTDAEKNGYSVGYDIGHSLKRQLEGVDAASMARGLKDGMSGAAPVLSETEMKQRFVTLQQESARKIPEKNKKEGEAYLAKNKDAKGVKTTASGLQYKVTTTGKGKMPGLEDTVTVNYRGTLIDGTEFDSSYRRGQPATFPVKGVIPGWTEALQLMPTGSKWMLYIPSSLAYGERGAGPMIGPNSTLIFEVELLSIAPSKP